MIQVFDSWASELSPSSFKIFSLPYLNYIADNLPARLESKGLEPVPMTVFAKGAWYALSDLCDSKYHTIGLDWLHDPAEAYKVARAKGKTLQGNADPGVLYGTHESITKVVEEMVAGFEGGKQGWIANLGHGMSNRYSLLSVKLTAAGITPFVKPDDLKFYFQEIHRLTK
jgi:uroporphyrinogen decarboxylase